jgi:NAD(P)H dehydrogenase (quinone)
VSPGYADPIRFQVGNLYGVSFQSNNGTVKPDETAKARGRFQGQRVVEISAKYPGVQASRSLS